jgi:hypothetical protein
VKTCRRVVPLLLCACLLALGGLVSPAHADDPTGPLTGRVLTPDGKPVPGATVTCIDRREPRYITLATSKCDENGVYRFLNITMLQAKSPHFSLLAEAPGWGATVCRLQQPAASPDITLLPAGRLEFTFQDEAGKPITGVTLVIGMLITPQRVGTFLPDELQQRFTAQTDKDGRCAISGLPQGGEVRMSMTDPRFAGLNARQRILLGLEPVTKIAPITLLPPATIQGTVRYSPTGKPAAGIWVWAMIESGTSRVLTDADGHYTFTRRRPGAYIIAPELSEEISVEWACVPRLNVNVAKGGKLTGIDFTLVKGVLVTGKVTTDDGTPLPDIDIRIENKDKWYCSQSAKTGKDGVYRVCVLPDTYQVTLSEEVLPGFLKPKPMSYPITVKKGDSITCDFKLPRSTVKPIHGLVLGPDGKPAVRAEIIAESLEQDYYYNFLPVKSDTKGEFTLVSIPVILRARLGELATAAVTRLPEGGEVTLRLEAGVLCTITGLVTDSEDNPVADVKVTLSGQSALTDYRAPAAVTDKSGRYTLTSLAPGVTYYLETSAPGYGPAHIVAITPKPGEIATAQAVVLNKCNSFVAGKLVDSEGHPLASTKINVRGPWMGVQEITTDDKGAFRVAGFKGEEARFEIQIQQQDGDWLQQTIKVAGQTDLVIVSKEKTE